MKWLNKFFLLSVLAAVIFLSGCISIDYNQKIKSDGSSEIEIVYDFSAILDMAKGFSTNKSELSEFEKNFTQICPQVYKETTFKNTKCRTTDDYKLIINGELSLKDSPAFKVSKSIPYVTYKYDLKNIYVISGSSGNVSNLPDLSELLQEAKSMMSGAMHIEYIIEMPGKITKSDVGQITDNKVKINLFNRLSQKSPHFSALR